MAVRQGGRFPMLGLALLCWTAVFIGSALIPTYPWILLIHLARGFALAASVAISVIYAAGG